MNMLETALYNKSNEIEEVKFTSFRKEYASKVLKCGASATDRQRASQNLLNYLCDKYKIGRVKLTVTTRPRKQIGRNTQLYGYYRPIIKTICIYNTTAKTDKAVGIKTFFDTLIHEFIHHYDFEYLKFSASPHTSGFYKRISDLKTKLI